MALCSLGFLLLGWGFNPVKIRPNIEIHPLRVHIKVGGQGAGDGREATRQTERLVARPRHPGPGLRKPAPNLIYTPRCLCNLLHPVKSAIVFALWLLAY